MAQKKYSVILVLVLFSLLAAIFHFSSTNIPDPDSFYHIRHADIYRAEGLFKTDFPWTYYSVIRTLTSDLWYGFHIFLIPFTYFNDLILGIKIAGILLTTICLFIFYFIARRHQLKLIFIWPLLFFFSAPNVLYRFLMTRPHLVSFSLSMLLFSFLISGGFLSVFLTSFGIAWFHLSLIWIPLLLAIVISIVKKFNKEKIEWFKLTGLLAGILFGWLLRPNSIGAIKLVYIQVVKLIFEKQASLPLLFGRELFPLDSATLFQNFSLFMFLWISAIFIFIWLYRYFKIRFLQNQILIWSSLILSFLFFFLTILVARRAYDLWISFGLIFIAAIFSFLIILTQYNKNFGILNNITSFILMGIFIFMVIFSTYKNSISLEREAIAPDHFKEAAIWLKENTQPKEIVFNLHWSNFPILFFWNQKNYYIGGMDPIFQYAYNSSLYWKFHFLSADQVTKKTCGAIACTREMLEDTYEVLKKDFNAKYIFIEKQFNPLVYSFLESDSRFEKKIDTISEAVYLIR